MVYRHLFCLIKGRLFLLFVKGLRFKLWNLISRNQDFYFSWSIKLYKHISITKINILSGLQCCSWVITWNYKIRKSINSGFSIEIMRIVTILAILHLGPLRISSQHRYIVKTLVLSFCFFLPWLLPILKMKYIFSLF